MTPQTLEVGESASLTADVTHNSNGADVGAGFPDGVGVEFATDLGGVSPEQTETENAQADSQLSSNTPGSAIASATLDNATVMSEPVTFTETPPPPGECSNLIAGDQRPNTLTGGALADKILGRGADDELFGRAATDCLSGGANEDAIYGGAGGDRAYGKGGGDQIWGRDGGDRIGGGPGRDRLRGEDGGDLIKGGPAIDRLRGGSGDDRLQATDGRAELITCGPGNDTATIDFIDTARGCETVSRRR